MLPDDTLQGIYKKKYQPAGVGRLEYYGAVLATIGLFLLFMGAWLFQANLIGGILHGIFGQYAAFPFAILFALAVRWFIKTIERDVDPLGKRAKKEAERDEVRKELLREIRDGKYIS